MIKGTTNLAQPIPNNLRVILFSFLCNLCSLCRFGTLLLAKSASNKIRSSRSFNSLALISGVITKLQFRQITSYSVMCFPHLGQAIDVMAFKY